MNGSRGPRLGLVWMGLLGLLSACGSDSNAPPPPPPPTYSVGGTVSGLNGSITLANNGGDARTVNANGAFTFASQLGSGATYNVTITAQPATQTCTLSGATGAVAAANVSTVTVTCVTNTVTIGGTVTGLVGSGLVLQNNGRDDLVIAANGAFTFATRIDAGTAYSMTVLSQPPGQLCTPGAPVGGPSGIANANVTNLVVECQSIVYSVGGTFAANPSGASVVLQLNGASNLSLSSPGSFTIGSGLTMGSPYAVTLLSESSTSGLPCVITGGTGTMGPGPVTNVVVTCPAPPVFTTVPVGQTVQAPSAAMFQVAVSGTPTPTLQWQVSTDSGATWNDIPGATQASYLTPATTVADNGKRFRVVATNSVSSVNSASAALTVTTPGPAKAWSTPIRISDELGQGASPKIAFTQSGDAIAVWQQYDPNNFRYDVWAARYATATGWSAPIILDTESGAALSVDVAMDRNGNALVVWLQNDGVRNNVWAIRYVAGAGWGTAAPIENDDREITDGSVRVVIDNLGRGLALWRSSEPTPATQQHLRTAVFDGNWQPDATVLSSALGFESLDVAVSRDGVVAVVYAEFASYSPLVSDIVAADCSISSGQCSVIKQLEPDSSGGWDSDAHVAINASDVAVAVWRRYDQATNTFRLRTSRTNQGVWSNTPEYIDSPATSVDAYPAVAIDSFGNAIAVWAQKLGAAPAEKTTIYASRYSTTTGWGTGAPLESQNRIDDIFPSQRPRVAFGAGVEAMAVWESGGGLITGAAQSGGAWEIDRDIAGANGVSRTPQVVFDAFGAAVAIFVQNSGFTSMPSIFVSRYE